MSSVLTAILTAHVAICAAPAVGAPEVYRVEAEALVAAYGFESLQGLRPANYSHASNKLLKMLERLSQSGSPQGRAAAELLDKAVQEVAATPDRPELAEQYRAEMIEMLSAERRP